MHLDAPTPTAHELNADMRQFILNQAEGRTDETVQRYVQVADELATFLDAVDVGPWLGHEIAALCETQRGRSGPGSFLADLGLLSFIRVLPAFVEEPWLPPAGAQRRTHRTVVRQLMTFLRREAHQQNCLRRDDFKAIDRALGHASSLDYPRSPRYGPDKVTCTVTVDLLPRLVDGVLEQVAHDHYATFDEAIAARLNPVERTYWDEPDQSLPDGW